MTHRDPDLTHPDAPSDPSDNDHLKPTTTNRGFSQYPPIDGTYGDAIRVYESSAADGPHLWVRVNDPDGAGNAAVHLAAAAAWQAAEQIQDALRRHYQGDATPEGGR